MGIIQGMELTEEQIRQEAADCYARKVRRAQRMSPIEKFLAGAELFEDACRISLARLRNDHPELSNAEFLEKLRILIRSKSSQGRNELSA